MKKVYNYQEYTSRQKTPLHFSPIGWKPDRGWFSMFLYDRIVEFQPSSRRDDFLYADMPDAWEFEEGYCDIDDLRSSITEKYRDLY